MREIYRRLRGNPNLFIQLLIASLFISILALATPIFVIQVLQRYIAHGVSSTLSTLVVGILIVILFEFFFRNIRHRMAGELEFENATLFDSIFKKINAIPISTYELNGKISSDLIIRNMQTVNQVFNAHTALIIIDTPFILIFLLALTFLHYQLAIITVAFIVVQIIISKYFLDKINSDQFKYQKILYDKSLIINEASNKYTTIRYFNFLKLMMLKWKKMLDVFIKLNDNIEINKNTLNSFLYSLTLLLTVIIISWGATLVTEGSLTIGALIGANILASRCLSPITKLLYSIEPLKKGNEALLVLRKILSIKSESLAQSSVTKLSGKIKIKDLSFKYPGSNDTLFHSISIESKPRDIIAIKGNSYSGKTTLLKIIAGIIEVENEKLYFDDIEMSQIPISLVRNNLFYMPQKIDLIDSTILTNIINSGEIKKDKFTSILDQADLQDYINSLPDGINTILDNDIPERIKKKIAIARSIFLDGNIVLLDEPLHEMDKTGILKFYNLFDNLIERNKTIFIATNNEDIIGSANIVIDLNSNEVKKLN